MIGILLTTHWMRYDENCCGRDVCYEKYADASIM